MSPTQPQTRPTRQRVVGVGPSPGLLDGLEPLFSEFSIKAIRITFGAPALEQIRNAPPDLLIVEHPLADMGTEEFVRTARGIVDGRCTILVLTRPDRLAELSRLEERGEALVHGDGPGESLIESTRSLLRQDPRCPRTTMVRLGVSLGDSQLLRLAQTVNLSLHGMLVRTSEHFPLGSEVRFEIILPDAAKPIRGYAKAVRFADRDKEGLAGIGLRFLELDDDGGERLERYLQPED